MPLVSVIMAAHNAEPFIGCAIASVLEQTCGDLELIVVDDRSTDRTVEVAASRAQRDERVRILRNPENRGPGHSRNVGIDHATGEWIAILDADDWYHPKRLEVLLGQARAHGADAVADNQFFMVDADRPPVRRLRHVIGRGPERLTAVDLLRGDRAGGSANLGLLKPVLRRSVLEEHALRYDECRGLGEDFYFLLSYLARVPYMLFVTRPYYYYRHYWDSWSNSLGIESYAGTLAIHRRHKDLFDPAAAPKAAQLMQRRERQLIRYMRYQRIALPFKAGRLREGIKEAMADPGVLLAFLPSMSRYFWRRLTIPREARGAIGRR